MSDRYEYTDPEGDKLLVWPAGGRPTGRATVRAETADGSGWAAFLPAHKLAGYVTALYEACGQPAPALPYIPDPAVIEALAADLTEALDNVPAPPFSPDSIRLAATALTATWQRRDGEPA
jgi:hypothetical protein